MLSEEKKKKKLKNAIHFFYKRIYVFKVNSCLAISKILISRPLSSTLVVNS